MPSASLLIRSATEADAAAMLAIYGPVVAQTAISFEEEVPSLEEFAARVRKYLAGHVCLVAESSGRVVGYGYGFTHRERAAYRWSAETTLYVSPEFHRQGVGRQLYSELLPRLASAGFCNAFAGVALPNPSSVGLHLAVGFSPIGTFPRVGYKFDRWQDVAWFHRVLREAPPS